MSYEDITIQGYGLELNDFFHDLRKQCPELSDRLYTMLANKYEEDSPFTDLQDCRLEDLSSPVEFSWELQENGNQYCYLPNINYSPIQDDPDKSPDFQRYTTYQADAYLYGALIEVFFTDERYKNTLDRSELSAVARLVDEMAESFVDHDYI